MGTVREQTRAYPNGKEKLIGFVAEFYTRIFDLLARIMFWCEAKSSYRIWKTLKRNCFQEFQEDLDRIKEWASNMTPILLSSLAEESHQTAKSVQELRQMVQLMIPKIGQYHSERGDVIQRKEIQAAEAEFQRDPESFLLEYTDKLVPRLVGKFRQMGGSGVELYEDMAQNEFEQNVECLGRM